MGQRRMTVLVLEFDGQPQPITRPRHRDPQTEPYRQTRMPRREMLNPKGVPTSAQNEQLPTHRLDGVGEEGNIDTGANRVGSVHGGETTWE